jgi:hypothetical protein
MAVVTRPRAHVRRSASQRIWHEAGEHEVVREWLDFLGILYWHTPNGGYRDIVTAARLKRAGVKAGIADFVIVDRPPVRPNAPGVWLEMKCPSGGRESEAQKRWRHEMSNRGWVCHVAKGADDAITFLKCMGYAERGR